MPAKKARHKPGETCPQCNTVHLTKLGKPACVGHVVYDRDSYEPGKDRKKLDQPRGCQKSPRTGLATCRSHGSATEQAAAAGRQRDAEAKARAAVEKLGGPGEPVTDPIGTLCAIAGRAVELMQQFGARVAELALPEHGLHSDTARAEIALYERSIARAASVVESIIRMGIAERFAKQNAEAVAAYVACLDAIVTDLGHNPRDPEVAGVIARRLELVG